jgi:hypothetical protein
MVKTETSEEGTNGFVAFRGCYGDGNVPALACMEAIPREIPADEWEYTAANTHKGGR